jgi:MEDS: MEthanogen/methylotroph, DcmR Sensory domain
VSRVPQAEERSHRVLTYRHDAQLIDVAGGVVADALRGSGAAIVLASARHLDSLQRWVRLCGVDLESASAERRYDGIAFDTASDWLSDRVDAAATFRDRLDELIAYVPDPAAPVHVVCGVGASLWEDGLPEATLDIEAVLNSLGATRPVSLLCAYPDDVFARPADAERICGQHAEVVNAPSFPERREHGAPAVLSVVLPPAPASCRTLRQLVRTSAPLTENGTAIDSAELIVSELAGNAVRHAGSTFAAEVLSWNGSVRLAVTDAAPLPSDWEGFPVAPEHGLGLVAAIARDWAVEPLAGGKVIWADIAREEV